MYLAYCHSHDTPNLLAIWLTCHTFIFLPPFAEIFCIAKHVLPCLICCSCYVGANQQVCNFLLYHQIYVVMSCYDISFVMLFTLQPHAQIRTASLVVTNFIAVRSVACHPLPRLGLARCGSQLNKPLVFLDLCSRVYETTSFFG